MINNLVLGTSYQLSKQDILNEMHDVKSNGLDHSLICVPTTTQFPRRIQNQENISAAKQMCS